MALAGLFVDDSAVQADLHDLAIVTCWGIKFVTPVKRHSGSAIAICQQRADVYEKARRAVPTPWSRHAPCWNQPEEVWINKPIEDPNPIQAPTSIQAA